MAQNRQIEANVVLSSDGAQVLVYFFEGVTNVTLSESVEWIHWYYVSGASIKALCFAKGVTKEDVRASIVAYMNGLGKKFILNSK